MSNDQKMIDALEANAKALNEHTSTLMANTAVMKEFMAHLRNGKIMSSDGKSQEYGSDKAGKTTSTTSARQAVIDKVISKSQAQGLHKSIMFKRCHKYLVNGTDPSQVKLGYNAALDKMTDENKKNKLELIEKCKTLREEGKAPDNKRLIGFFSSIACCEWNLLTEDDKLVYRAMETYWKGKVENFYDDNISHYEPVDKNGKPKKRPTTNSIYREFRLVVTKAWSENGFGWDGQFLSDKEESDIKFEMKPLTKEEIHQWIDKVKSDNGIDENEATLMEDDEEKVNVSDHEDDHDHEHEDEHEDDHEDDHESEDEVEAPKKATKKAPKRTRKNRSKPDSKSKKNTRSKKKPVSKRRLAELSDSSDSDSSDSD